VATIDDKVVAMSFESSKFESGVHNTISALDKLKAALHFPHAGKGLDEVAKSAGKFDLSHIAGSVDALAGKFTALNVTAVAVLANLANKAVTAGINFAKSFTVEPIKAGFAEYSTNLNSIQTILANTQASGANLKDVNAALDELNTYSDKTIYNFSEMAKNIGTFTAAGVDLDTSTQSIKGIANLAALSGSNSQQAATAMYQLSQAISAGKVGLQDWNSVVNAGMGGTVFQRALATTADNMGLLKDGALKLVGPMKNVSINGESFRQSIQAGPGKQSWLTSKVLTETLKQFTGDLSDAQLKAQGFNDAQIKAIQQTAKTAQHAATEVKTISQVFDVAKETAGSGWAQTFRIIFGDFEEAKKTFTDMSNTINGFINASADARNKVLGDWKALGGRTVLIEGIKNAFEALMQILAPIKDAFRSIFPPATGEQLFNLTKAFEQLTERMKPSKETVANIRTIFTAVFQTFKFGIGIVEQIFGVFKRLFGVMDTGHGGFLSFIADIAVLIMRFESWLEAGDKVTKFFDGLGDILEKPIKLIHDLASALGDLFGGFSSGGFSDQIDGMTESLNPFQRVMEAVSKAWDKFIGSFDNTHIMESVLNGLVSLIQGIGPALGNAVSNINFEAILSVFRTGLFAGLVLMFKQFLGKGSFLDQVSKGFAGGILKNISGMFGTLEGTMKSFQTNLKAKTLKEIAIAIGILTASVVALSFVDPENLKKSLTAITVMFGQLLGAMKILEGVSTSGGFMKIPVIAGALILLGGAIDILAIAVFALSKLSWEELTRGLTGVGALLGGLAVAVKPLSANSAGMIRAGIGIGLIAVSLNILVLAVKQLAGLSWQEMIRGLTGVGGGLAALTAATMKMPAKGMIQMGIGVTTLATGLKILASAMADFAAMDLKEIGKGLVSVGGSLAIMARSMKLMPKGMVQQAAALIGIAYALGLIADAMSKMGGMSQKELEKGFIGIGGALVILAVGLTAMEGALPGAAALTVASVGISMLAGAMQKLGGMSWTEIIKSLVAIAAAIGVLAAASLLLVEAVPAMLALGAALVLIGGGLALAGAGVFLVGAGLSAIAVAGPAALGVMVAAFQDFTKAMIENAKLIILGVLEIVEQLAKTAPKFVAALVKILDQLLNVIIQSMPKIVKAFQAILDGILKLLKDNQDKIIQAGFDLIISLAKGIEKNLPEIVKTAGNIIVKFLEGLTKKIPDILKAGVDLLIALMDGIIKDIGKITEKAFEIVLKFLDGIAKKMPDIVKAGIELLVQFLNGIAKNLDDLIGAAADVIIQFIDGLAKKSEDIVGAGVAAVLKFIEGLGKNALLLAIGAMKVMLDFLNGLTAAVNLYEPQIVAATISLGIAIIKGIIVGVGQKAADLWTQLRGIVAKAKHIITHPWEAFSPSKFTMALGQDIMDGMVIGLKKHAAKVYDAAKDGAMSVVHGFTNTLGITSPSKVMIEIGKQVNEGFAIGLRGSQDEIKNAFKEMNDTMLEETAKARENIASEQDKLQDAIADTIEKGNKLNELRKKKGVTNKEINEAKADLLDSQKTIREIRAVLLENENVLKKTEEGTRLLTEALANEKHNLLVAAGNLQNVTKELEKAQAKLDEIKKARKDIVDSTFAEFSKRPELDTTTPEELKAAKDKIDEEDKQVKKDKDENKKAEDEIKKQQIAVDAAKADLAKKEAAGDADDIQNAKDDLSKQEEDLQKLKDDQKEKADAVTQSLLAADAARKEYNKLIEDKVLDKSGLAVDQLKTYEQALIHQTNSVTAYNATLQNLRKMGLSDDAYRKLVSEGIADAQFANELEKAGPKAVEKLNKLDAKLSKAATTLSNNVGTNLYAVGQRGQQKVVDGFKSDKKKYEQEINTIGHNIIHSLKTGLRDESADLDDVMVEIGKKLTAGLKKALAMKSPSKVMMEIGKFSVMGLAQGLTDSAYLVEDAANQVAKDTLAAMQTSMGKIHGAVLNELDATPVITPILDLTIVRTQARELNALTSSGQASIISSQQSVSQNEVFDAPITGTSVQFNQNNYSPESLSAIEIYRQTRNQLSQLKSALAITTP
jgi:tape measure domain-containing protein